MIKRPFSRRAFFFAEKKRPVTNGLFCYLCRLKKKTYGEEQNDVLL